MPTPPGVPWVARVLHRSEGGGRWLLQHPDGRIEEIGEQPVDLVTGLVHVRLAAARRMRVQRFELPSIQGSVAWLAMVVMATLFTVQVVWVQDHLCEMAVAYLPHVPDVMVPLLWAALPPIGIAVAVGALVVANDWRGVRPVLLAPLLGIVVPVAWQLSGATPVTGEAFLAGGMQFCFEQPSNAVGSPFTAEYLARLLKKDYAGEEKGVIEDRIERPDAERETERHMFLPAGAEGPITKMGGASETSVRPVRTLVVEADPVVQKKRHGEKDAPTETGPVPTTKPDGGESSAAGKERGLELDATADGEDPTDAPAEEVEGWGVPGWYDEKDIALENLEIDVMLKVARRRLRIDPDDIDALGILSYYQYLAQDYRSALQTYDHILELYPEDAAGYNNKALVYKRQQDYRREEGLYRKALSLQPMDETALNNLAVNLSHQGRFDEALAIMQDLETIDPEDPYADLHRAKIHAEMGHDEQALKYLDLALAGMARLDTLHHIEFRQDIRLDPSFAKLREDGRFKSILIRYYGKDSPLEER
ncbi:MAG: tetratricopeptide repeat protein [Myxococcales bacterium]|nr:tetratricopeptide repeat protein [Myxococcales bacterium]